MTLNPTKAAAVADALEDLINSTSARDLSYIQEALRTYESALRLQRKALTLSEHSAEYTAERDSIYAEIRTLLGL